MDVELVRRGLARSRVQARRLVEDGAVLVDDHPCARPATEVSSTSVVRVVGPVSPWVSRGAEKLVHALTTWPIPVEGARALDVGASTGGFTQVLLARGAAGVVALDVGHGQLHPTVAADAKVDNREGRSVRDLGSEALDPMDVVVADLSFISLRLALGPISQVLAPTGHVVVLVKPQFEVGRERLGKHGIVTNPVHRAEALRGVIGTAEEAGLVVHGVDRSPITGTHGNEEYLLWLRPERSARMEPADVEDLVAAITEDARGRA